MTCSMTRRILAFLIDASIIGVMSSAYARAVSPLYFEIFTAIYFLGFAYFNEGRTVGKLVTNLEIVALEGGLLMRRNFMFRELVKIILIPFSPVSFVFCLFNPQRLSIHDIILNTVVVKRF